MSTNEENGSAGSDIYTMKYCSATKKRFLMYATSRRNTENIRLNKKNIGTLGVVLWLSRRTVALHCVRPGFDA